MGIIGIGDSKKKKTSETLAREHAAMDMLSDNVYVELGPGIYVPVGSSYGKQNRMKK
ncbi:MAG: hypothetical protein PHU12_04315 [Candidatus Aenigmarchaeota archaeon]|nr:hypothetical protein [Candidatus Aenigmarchaeota archaeon]